MSSGIQKRGEVWGISIKLLFKDDGIEDQSKDWASGTPMARWGEGWDLETWEEGE